MIRHYFKAVILVLVLVWMIPCLSYGQSIGIGAVTFIPNASAALHIDGVTGFATPKGILVPKMTTAQRNTIASPVSGLLIYNEDDDLAAVICARAVTASSSEP